MRLSKEAREAFRKEGRKGGLARARRLSAGDRRAIARQAAVRRWIRVRFGDASFAALGLPGGAMIDQGPPLVLAGDAFAGPRVEGAALSGWAAAEAVLGRAS